MTFVLYDTLRIRKKVIFKNLDIAFKDSKTPEEKKYIARSSFYHFLLTILEFLHARNGEIADDMKIFNSESIRESVSSNQGAYVIAMHMSNWEAAAAAVSRQIKPVYVVVKNVGSEGSNRLVTKLRIRNGMNIIPRKSTGDAVRAMRKTIKDGNIVAVIMDQSRPGEPKLPFFDRPAKTNTSFPAIWSRIKAPVFMAYSVRISAGKHKLYFKEPIQLQITSDPKEDTLANAALINKKIEECIRECPEQYFWLHDRWKE